MALNNVSLVYSYYPDPEKSQAISEGDAYVGNPDTDPEIVGNQKQVYHRQENGTDVPVSQPLKTGAGGVILINGSPAQIVVDGNYSLKVLDKQGAQKYYDANRNDGTPLTEENLGQVGIRMFDTVANAVAATDLTQGLFVGTRGYWKNGDDGAANYIVVSATDTDRTYVQYADHVITSSGDILRYVPDEFSTIPVEQCGVQYLGPGQEETKYVQAAIDVGRSITDATPTPDDSGTQILIGGVVRINARLERCGRMLFQGIHSIRSRIVWTGGVNSGFMIDFQEATWGGLSRIRVQGFDQDAGQKPMADGISHLLRYSFVDFPHILEDVLLATGSSDAIKLVVDATVSENAITNMTFSNLFLLNRGEGSLLKIEASLGGKRLINIDALTINNTNSLDTTQPNTGAIIDASAVTTGFIVNIDGARIEYNSQVKANDFALFKMGTTSTENSGRSVINLSGFAGFVTGNQVNSPIVSAVEAGTVIVNESGCSFSNAVLLKYTTGDEIVTATTLDRTSSATGLLVNSQTIGRNAVLSGNYADRLTSSNSVIFKRGDVAFSYDGISDYLVPEISESDDHFYSYALTGFISVGRLTGVTSGLDSATVAANSPGIGFIVGLAIRILGAGVAGGNLDTFVKSVDMVTDTVVFEDAASTTVAGEASVQSRSTGHIQGFNKPRSTTPADLSTSSFGQDVYIQDLGVWATWSEDRWMYASNHHVTTANRPVYTTNTKYVGLSVFDTTIGKPIWWTGTGWVDATGSGV